MCDIPLLKPHSLGCYWSCYDVNVIVAEHDSIVCVCVCMCVCVHAHAPFVY